MVIWLYSVARVAECMDREVRRRDIRSTLRAVMPFGGISVASWSIIEPDIRVRKDHILVQEESCESDVTKS